MALVGGLGSGGGEGSGFSRGVPVRKPGQRPGEQDPIAPINIETTYDPNGTVHSHLPLRPLDIGPMPDFWADMAQFARRSRPTQAPSAPVQARALRAPDTTAMERPSGPTASYLGDDAEFATMIGRGPQSAGVAYDPWHPGQGFSPGNTPVATYSGPRKRA